jgi:hypothetical protein
VTQRDREELEALERALLTGTVRTDAAALDALLAEEFREFGASGRTYTKNEIVEALRVESSVVLALKDFRAERIGEGIVLVTYRSSRSEVGHATRHALRSSIWVRRDGRWQIVFHQGTVVPGRDEASQGAPTDIQS